MLSWKDIEGQDGAKQVLERSIAQRRLHPGMLFVGPQGVGKFQMALAFARILLCRNVPDGQFRESCGECSSCRKLDNELQHPDLHVATPQGGVNKTIKIDQVRAIGKIASTRPYESTWQIIVFDDAHAMTDEAANALLKTLEEPPSSMLIILVTDQPHALISTIRSRCQMLRFGALDDALVVRLLRNSGAEGRLDVAAAYGGGSVGKARAVLDSGLLEERASMVEILASLDRKRPGFLFESAEKFSKDRATMGPRLDVLSVLLRDVLMLQAGTPNRVVNADLEGPLARVAQRFDTEGLIARADAVRVARELLARNVHAQMIAENLVTELAPGPSRPPLRLPPL